MTKEEIAALICRVFAIYSFASALNSLTYFSFLLPSLTDPSRAGKDVVPQLVGAFIPFGSLLLLSFILWVSANKLGRFLIPKNMAHPQSAPITSLDWQKIAFSTLGLYFFFNAILSISYGVMQLLLEPHSQITNPFVGDELIGQMVQALLRLILGALLLIGTNSMLKFLKKSA